MLLAFYWALVISAISFEFELQHKLTADIHCLYHIAVNTTLYVTTLDCCCNIKIILLLCNTLSNEK